MYVAARVKTFHGTIQNVRIDGSENFFEAMGQANSRIGVLQKKAKSSFRMSLVELLSTKQPMAADPEDSSPAEL